MNFRELSYVCAIEKYKTISKAAEELYISQPSLSTFLKELESKLEMKLFERKNKKLILTYAGEIYIKYANEILNHSEKMRYELKQIADSNHGRLSVGATPGRARYVLPFILPKFKKKYPNFDIDIHEASPTDLITLLDSNIVDFAIMTIDKKDRQNDNNHEFYHMKLEEIVLCSCENNPIKNFAYTKKGFLYPWIDLKKLEDQTFLMVPEIWRTGIIAKECLRKAKIHPKTIHISVVETATAIASNGLGVCFCPDIMITRGNFKTKPTYFSIGDEANILDFVIITRKSFPLTKAYKDFIDISKKELNQ